MHTQKSPNPSIKCSVKQCAHHCGTKEYCALDNIMVGTHEANPSVPECTDCRSFVPKQSVSASSSSSSSSATSSMGTSSDEIPSASSYPASMYDGRF